MTPVDHRRPRRIPSLVILITLLPLLGLGLSRCVLAVPMPWSTHR